MNCCQRKNQLSPYLDGRLPPAAARRLEAHLEECARCRAEWEELRALKALLAGSAPPPAPPGLWDVVYAGLREHVDRRPAPRPAAAWTGWLWRRAPVMTAGLAILALAAILPVQRLQQSPAGSGVTIDELVARHAGYCARQPLLEHASLHYLVAEAGADDAE